MTSLRPRVEAFLETTNKMTTAGDHQMCEVVQRSQPKDENDYETLTYYNLAPLFRCILQCEWHKTGAEALLRHLPPLSRTLLRERQRKTGLHWCYMYIAGIIPQNLWNNRFIELHVHV